MKKKLLILMMFFFFLLLIKGCRCDCQDQAEVTKTVHLENITDVKVAQPAGGCIPKNVLSTLSIETAGGSGIPEIVAVGLYDAEFVRRVRLKHFFHKKTFYIYHIIMF